jgi:ligand-binding sensor domain-containing protein
MRRLAVVLVLAGCGPAISGGAGLPTPASAFRPEDRVVLGNFARVNAIAAAFDRVFVAFPTAVGLWRPLAQRWEVPRTPPRPTMLRDVRLAIMDPADQSLWLGTSQGWVHYTPTVERWDEGPLPGTPTAIAVDPMDALGGAWFRIEGRWYRQSRIGGATTPATPSSSLQMAPTIDDALRDMPQLRSIAPRLVTGPGLEQGRLTAAAPLADGTSWLLGTSNLGVLKLDRIGATAPPLTLGLRGTGVGAIALLPDGIWVATDAELRTSAELAFLPIDLSTSMAIDGTPPFGLPFAAARRIVASDRALWLATDQGVVRLTLPERRTTRWGDVAGLPDPRTLSLVLHQGQMIAGTMRGLAVLQEDGKAERLALRFVDPAYALLSRGDTLWVGTRFGLRAWMPGEAALGEPEGFARLGGAQVPVRGIGYVADTLVAMTESQLLWRDPGSGAWTAGPVLSGLGRLTAFAVTPDGIWVGGDRGAGFLRPTSPLLRSLSVPIDLPGGVTAIASEGSYLWIGTTEGLVRLRLQGR